MEKAPRTLTNSDIINNCEISINKIKADEKKLGDLARDRILNLAKNLEKNGLHLPEFIVLESALIDPQSKFDGEKIYTIEYFKRTNQLIRAERTISGAVDFPIGGFTFGADVPRKDQKEDIKELDSKSWIKYGPQIIRAFGTLNQNKISQKS